MYNKVRLPGAKLPFWPLQTHKKQPMFYARFLATQKNLNHPDLLSLLIAREVVLPSFCPGGSRWGQHGGPMGPKFRTQFLAAR